MAGSYGRAVADDGQLLGNEDFVAMVGNLGDAYEIVEEMYGMIWWLAGRLPTPQQTDVMALVQAAVDNYMHGLEWSLGTAGALSDRA